MSLRKKVALTSLVVMMLPYGIGHLAFVLMLSAILNVTIESRVAAIF
jgi:hypothetical protein